MNVTCSEYLKSVFWFVMKMAMFVKRRARSSARRSLASPKGAPEDIANAMPAFAAVVVQDAA